MRLLVVTNLYPPVVLGGYEILCAQVSEELGRRGHEVTVLTSDYKAPSDKEAPVGSASNVHRILQLYEPFENPAQLSRGKRFRTGRHNYRVTRNFLKDRNIDLAFVWSQLRLTLGAARAVQHARLPVAFTFNDPHPLSYVPAPFSIAPRGFLRYAADRFLFSGITLQGLRFDVSTCISQYLKDQLIAGRFPASKMQVIYQGIPLDRFPLKPEPGSIGSPVRVLYAGQLHPYKGVHTLIEAMSLLARRSGGDALSLTIAGDGPEDYKRRLHELAAGCPAPVDFPGKVPHEQIPELYRNHDVFVFPSEWPEPFGLTHLEAMASGTPVISTTEGGHGEFLEDETNCLAFPKADAPALGRCMERLIADPALGKRLAAAGRQVVEEKLNLNCYVTQLEAFLEQAAYRREQPS